MPSARSGGEWPEDAGRAPATLSPAWPSKSDGTTDLVVTHRWTVNDVVAEDEHIWFAGWEIRRYSDGSYNAVKETSYTTFVLDDCSHFGAAMDTLAEAHDQWMEADANMGDPNP
jgi:hypothetical protein